MPNSKQLGNLYSGYIVQGGINIGRFETEKEAKVALATVFPGYANYLANGYVAYIIDDVTHEIVSIAEKPAEKVLDWQRPVVAFE
jgi:hypothetical protein